jgi:hypothetical protein
VLAAVVVLGITGYGPVHWPSWASRVRPGSRTGRGGVSRPVGTHHDPFGITLVATFETSLGPTAQTPVGRVPAGVRGHLGRLGFAPRGVRAWHRAVRARAVQSIARTLNRGASWAGLPAPAVSVGAPGQAGVVWGIRFATPAHGFVFGDGLWGTADGAVVHEPADSDGHASQRPGQLVLTDDARASWYPVSF